jgi:hypothetical protein
VSSAGDSCNSISLSTIISGYALRALTPDWIICERCLHALLTAALRLRSIPVTEPEERPA